MTVDRAAALLLPGLEKAIGAWIESLPCEDDHDPLRAFGYLGDGITHHMAAAALQCLAASGDVQVYLKENGIQSDE